MVIVLIVGKVRRAPNVPLREGWRRNPSPCIGPGYREACSVRPGEIRPRSQAHGTREKNTGRRAVRQIICSRSSEPNGDSALTLRAVTTQLARRRGLRGGERATAGAGRILALR